MDPLLREMHISLGCALENLVLAGPPSGLSANVALLPEPADATHIATVTLTPTTQSRSPRFDAMASRHTNRGAYDTTRTVSSRQLDALRRLVDLPGTDVVWFTTDAQKRSFGELTVRATEAIIADPQQSADDYRWYRTGWQDIQQLKDGITIDPSGQSNLIRALAKLVPYSQEQNNDGWLSGTPGQPDPDCRHVRALIALLYVWVGTAAHGLDQVLGLAGGLAILAAVAVARRSRAAAIALLVVGALPLAMVTWWSIATPVLAVLALGRRDRRDPVDPFNPKAVRASAGRLFHLPVVRAADPVALVGVLAGAGLSVLATTGTATADLDTAGTRGILDLPTARLFGSQAHGLPQDVAALADESVRVPINGRAESLNPAAAAEICHTPAPVRTGGHLTERETSGT